MTQNSQNSEKWRCHWSLWYSPLDDPFTNRPLSKLIKLLNINRLVQQVNFIPFN